MSSRGDYVLNGRDASASGVVDATGAAIARIPGPRVGRAWKITHAIVNTTLTPTGICEATLYVGSVVTPSAYRDHSFSGQDDVSEYPVPLPVHSGDDVIVVWKAGAAGAVATVTIVYDDEPV